MFPFLKHVFSFYYLIFSTICRATKIPFAPAWASPLVSPAPSPATYKSSISDSKPSLTFGLAE